MISIKTAASTNERRRDDMIKMTTKEQVTSKAMIAGWFLFGLGVYIAVGVGDITGGMSVSGLGLGILGIRDAK